MTVQDTSPTPLPFAAVRPKISFAGDVLKLVSGTTFAQLLGIVAVPFLTRLYAPEAFGVMALFTSITSIVGVIACMRYELAIMLPETDEEAANLLGVSIGFAGLVSLLTVPIVWWGREPLLRVLNAEALAPYLWLMPAAVFLSGIFLAFNYWNSRTRQFGRLSVARVINSLATTSTTLGAGFAGYATAGTMIGASVGGQLITATFLGSQIIRDDGRFLVRSIHRRTVRAVTHRYRKFPLYSTWATLLNAISWQLPVFLLSAFFSTTVVGYYALGFRILQMPMNLIGGAIAQVFFQRAADAKLQGTLPSLVENTFQRLVMVAMFPILTLTIIGRDLYTIVFGPSWAEAGIYTQILGIWALVWFISAPLSTLFSVLEKQQVDFQINLALVIARLFALLVGGLLSDARMSLSLFAVTGVFVYSYQIFLATTSCGMPLTRVIQIFSSAFCSFLPFGALLLSAYIVGMDYWVKALIVLVISVWYLWRVARIQALSKAFLRMLHPTGI